MQTTTQHNRTNNSFTIIATLALCAFTGSVHANDDIGELALLDTADKWQTNRLFEPTPYQLNRETQGQIMIYDGLRDSTIKDAIDKNFERIGNMMFTRVVVTDGHGQPKLDIAGNAIIEDDGC